MVSREELQRWFHSLNSGESSTVKNEIMHILLTQKEEKKLTFDNIEVGKTYRLKAIEGTKKYLHHVPVTITEKKRTNVMGTLNEGAGNKKKGSKFTIPPYALEEIPSE